MKTRQQTLQLPNEKDTCNNFQTEKNNYTQTDFVKNSFCSANLWNIQKNRRTGITYRKYL